MTVKINFVFQSARDLMFCPIDFTFTVAFDSGTETVIFTGIKQCC